MISDWQSVVLCLFNLINKINPQLCSLKSSSQSITNQLLIYNVLTSVIILSDVKPVHRKWSEIYSSAALLRSELVWTCVQESDLNHCLTCGRVSLSFHSQLIFRSTSHSFLIFSFLIFFFLIKSLFLFISLIFSKLEMMWAASLQIMIINDDDYY